MDDLPDELLAHVLSFLPPRTLLGPVRGTCRRWRTVALDQHAWLAADLMLWWTATINFVHLALSSAPCLRRLNVSTHNMAPQLLDLLGQTLCVVTELCFSVDYSDRRASASVLSRATRIFRNMEPNVKRLQLSLSNRGLRLNQLTDEYQDHLEFLNVALNMTNVVELEVLYVYMVVIAPESVCSRLALGKPRLQKLTFAGCVEHSFMSLLIRTHSATLRSLDVTQLVRGIAGVFAALRECQQLREFRVRELETGLPRVLSNFPAFTTLHSAVSSDPSEDLKQEWVLYFTSAALGLTSLSLKSTIDDLAVLMCYLEALASSGQSALRCLTLRIKLRIGTAVSLPGFRAVLSGLPRLEEVDLDFIPGADVLDAVEGAALPGLHTLRLAFRQNGTERVPEERLRRLLRAHAQLHLVNACQPRRIGTLEKECSAEDRALNHCVLLALQHAGPTRKACPVCANLSSSITSLQWTWIDTDV